MPCDLRLPILTQWSSADPSPLQPFFSILRPACCGGGGVPLSLGRVIARFQLFSSHLWLALHQIRSSGYPPCPDTPAQPLSRRTPFACWWRRAVFLLATPAFRLRIISPASEPPLPITASIQIWCQLSHTHTYPIFSSPNAFCASALLAPLPLWRRRGVSSALLFRHQMHTYTLCNSLPQLHSVATIGATANAAHANQPR